jgi:peptidoglycan/xylan/chitin deacetylase (PgdA/CDA1 family)
MMSQPKLNWKPSPLIAGTLALHAALPVPLLLSPQSWPWVLTALVANHVLLTGVGLWPRSNWLGPNITRLPTESAARNEIALTIDDGPDPDVTPRVLDMLDRYQVKATFFCIGEQAARHPEICKTIVQRGHVIENHSQTHRHDFSLLGPKGLQKELEMAQRTLTAITGRRPQFFRAPAGLRNPFLDWALAKTDLKLAAWTRRGFDTRTSSPAIVLERLMRDLKPGAILLLHDRHCACTEQGTPVILEVLPRLLEAAAQAQLNFVTLPAMLKQKQS